MNFGRCKSLAMLLLALVPRAAPAAIELDSGEYLEWGSAPVTSVPLTIYCRFSIDTTDDPKTYVSIAQSGNHDDGSFTIGDNGFAEFRAYASEASAYSLAQLASPTISTNTWYHGFGRFDGATSRWAQLNSSDVQKTENLTPAGLNSVRVGATSPGPQALDGKIAEVCIWNDTLTSDERQAILDGARPSAVKPAAVVFYLSGIASTTAEIGGAPSEDGSPAIVSHPSVIYVTRAMAHAKRR